MKVVSLMLMLTAILVFSKSGGAQSPSKAGSIVLVDCKNCEDIVVKPSPVYPSYVGFGPHVWKGKLVVQIKIDGEGNVTVAKAISGHRYFRPYLEKASLKARFKASKLREQNFSAVFIFEVRPPS